MLTASQAEAAEQRLDPEELDRLAADLAGDPLTLDLDPLWIELWIELPPLPEVEEGPLPEVDR